MADAIKDISYLAADAVSAKVEAGLAKALGKALGLKGPATVGDAMRLGDRLDVIVQNQHEWYYLDGRCIFGVAPIQSQVITSNGDLVTIRFSRSELDPASAPAYPPVQGGRGA